MMPEMDGYELCRTIKQDEKTRSIPVILVTQLFDTIDVVKGLEAGADNFIIKPYEEGDISSRIEDVISAGGNTPEINGSIKVSFPDGVHAISSGRVQILNILLSTYAIAIRKNNELSEAQERLNLSNDKLQQAVSDLGDTNTSLHHEIQERKKVERALAEANKKLQLMASITRHDILNQLTALRGYLELARMNGEKEPGRANENIGSAESLLIQTINTVSFTGEYQKIGVKSPVWREVRTLVDDAVKYTRLGPVKLENAIVEGTEIYADPLIEKVFSNLIENAVRYGTKITKIRFGCEGRDGGWTIVCEDDGVGIPEDEKEKIFSYEYGMNTGLGLFLAREILAITGISIQETGTPGKGARFEMHCPEGTVRTKGEH
jgi:signal transduction histidine kinase